MKRSEFRTKAQERFTAHPDSVVRLAEEAGVRWDPEEPETPERISMADLGLPAHRLPPDREWLIGAEAAARYNAVGRFDDELERFLGETPSTTLYSSAALRAIKVMLERLTDEERARLAP